MGLFRELLVKDEPIRTYGDFWNWFCKHERRFFDVVKTRGEFRRDFFDIVTPKLSQLRDGLFLLSGMIDENTAELIITPDGNIKNIVFAEGIVAAAPNIDGWKFTALKPNTGGEFGLRMAGFAVTEENLWFTPNEIWEQPDKIDIKVVHEELTDENRDALQHAVFIFLDNYLGELSFVTTIDMLTVAGRSEVEKQLISIKELKEYLAKRQAEFVEKYDGIRSNTDDDPYMIMEAEFETGEPWIAMINIDLLKWDKKPSHPWIGRVEFRYTDDDLNGLPGDDTYQLLSQIEDEMLSSLKDSDGYLNVGHESAKNVRTVYFAYSDFRKPSEVFDQIQKKYADKFQIDFDIYKDKYWESFDRFLPTDGPELAN